MIYLKQFTKHSSYESIKNDLLLPNVSICKLEKDIHYNPYIDPRYQYVEIGGIKWATMNIGANNITDYGLYFQWGDTQGYNSEQVGNDKTFNCANYKYCDGGGEPSNMTKYNSTDNKTVLDNEDDVVKMYLGGNWRMPTYNDIQILNTSASNEWITNYQNSGVNGILFIDNIDNSKTLFLPAGGMGSNNRILSKNEIGYYWSSSIHNMYSPHGYGLYFKNNQILFTYSNTRYCGFSIRGILDE